MIIFFIFLGPFESFPLIKKKALMSLTRNLLLFLKEKSVNDVARKDQYQISGYELLNVLCKYLIPIEDSISPKPILLLFAADCVLTAPTTDIQLEELYQRINMIFSFLSGIIYVIGN